MLKVLYSIVIQLNALMNLFVILSKIITFNIDAIKCIDNFIYVLKITLHLISTLLNTLKNCLFVKNNAFDCDTIRCINEFI